MQRVDRYGGIAWGDNLSIDCCHRVISFSGFQLPPDFDQPSILTFAELETPVLDTIYYYRSTRDP